MHSAFWTGFEKEANVLDYAAIRAAELAKKRALPPKAINYAMLPKVAPKPSARVLPEIAKTPEQIFKERQKTVARGGLSHTMWEEMRKR